MDRMEWFVEKATEIGINAITCLNCRFSERKEIKPIRLEKILVSAMKQSQKATLPALEGMTDFKKFVATPFDGRKFIAHCEEGEKPLLKHTYQPGENALILIGPEGDFSPEEIKLAQENGFEPISLRSEKRQFKQVIALIPISVAFSTNHSIRSMFLVGAMAIWRLKFQRSGCFQLSKRVTSQCLGCARLIAALKKSLAHPSILSHRLHLDEVPVYNVLLLLPVIPA